MPRVDDHNLTRRTFFTGSRVYGEPKESSDVDMVMLVTEDEANMLRPLADTRGGSADVKGDFSLKFGRMNVLTMTSVAKFNAWLTATEKLIDRRPVTRDEAVKLIEHYEEQFNAKG